MPISQLVASGRYLIQIITQAFFDHRIVTQHIDEKHLGGWWEWSAYVGLTTLVVALFGGVNTKRKSIKSKSFQALVLGCVIQVIFCRYSEIVELYRSIIPPTKTMTFYFRGIILLVLLYGVLVAHGFEMLLSKKRGTIISLVFFLVALLELSSVYYFGGLMSPLLSKVYAEASYKIPREVSDYLPAETPHLHYLNAISAGTPTLACYNPPLLGYGGHAYLTQVQPNAISALRESNRLNMNDVTEMFYNPVTAGHFQKQAWPLWKQEDHARLQEFARFKQVIQLPKQVIIGRYISYGSLLVLLILTALALHLTNIVRRKRLTPRRSTQQT